jgi:hypothetical protein
VVVAVGWAAGVETDTIVVVCSDVVPVWAEPLLEPAHPTNAADPTAKLASARHRRKTLSVPIHMYETTLEPTIRFRSAIASDGRPSLHRTS